MDSVCDLLIRIKNAYLSRHKSLEIPYSAQKAKIVAILVENDYLEKMELTGIGVQKRIVAFLKYKKRKAAVTDIKIMSRPSLRVYNRVSDIRKVFGGNGISLISTSSGIMTGKDARKKKIGGELICQIW